jgi:hypothetical protein
MFCAGWSRRRRPRNIVAATATVDIGLAALDTAVACYPDRRFAHLRKGMLVIHGA